MADGKPMRFPTVTILTALIPLLAFTAAGRGATAEPFKSRTIYGTDDRVEVYAESNPAKRRLARSVAAIVSEDHLLPKVGGVHSLLSKSYKEFRHVCSSERFAEQPAAAHCTAFLIAPDLMVTAGHCIAGKRDCEEARFVFDFGYWSRPEGPVARATSVDDWSEISDALIYRCTEILHSESIPNGTDFAIVRLDRPVPDRAPLVMRKSPAPEVNTGLFMIGTPAGVPLKIANDGHVRSIGPLFFSTDLDALDGNSGSPVFNERTLEVEGVISRGGRDYIPTHEGCYVSYICTQSGCRGEDATDIASVVQILRDRN
jgi:hypothetical protein